MAIRIIICIALIVFIIRALSGFSVESSMIRSATVFLILFVGFKIVGIIAGIINNKGEEEEEYKEPVNQEQAG